MDMCIILSALTFVALFIAAIFSHQFVLLFISPLVSLFFILLTMGILAYNTTLGLRASQIEDLLKDAGVYYNKAGFSTNYPLVSKLQDFICI